jgi:hypothetical protein
MSMAFDLLSADQPLRRQALAQLQAQQWAQAWQSLQVMVALDPADAWAQR